MSKPLEEKDVKGQRGILSPNQAALLNFIIIFVLFATAVTLLLIIAEPKYCFSNLNKAEYWINTAVGLMVNFYAFTFIFLYYEIEVKRGDAKEILRLRES